MPGYHGKMKGYQGGGYVGPLEETLAAGQQLPTHAQGRQPGQIHPISPMEWQLLAQMLAQGGFDSPMPVLQSMPPQPDLPSMRRRPDGAMEIHLDPRAGRGV